MSRQKLSNRLDHLFADLGQETARLGAEAPVSQPVSSKPAPASKTSAERWAWECDAQGYYQRVDKQVEPILGWAPADFSGQPLATFALAPAAQDELQRVLAGGLFPAQVELTFVHKDGRQIPVLLEIESMPRRNEADHHPGGIYGSCSLIPAQPEQLQPVRSRAPGAAPSAAETARRARKTPRQGAPQGNGHLPAAESIPDRPAAETPPPLSPPRLTKTAFPKPAATPYSSLGISQPGLLGFRADDHGVHPSNQFITPLAAESIRTGKPVLQSKLPEQPAVLALSALPEGGQHLLLEILDEDNQRQWSKDELRLAEQVLDQLSMALENARLFESIQKALHALEVREHYQTNVAEAVAALADSGTSAMPAVLAYLGEAAGVGRAYFFRTVEDASGISWQRAGQWNAPGTELYSQISLPDQIPTHALPGWAEMLVTQGQVVGLATQFSPAEQEYCAAHGARSVLALAVPGEHAVPGFIGLDELNSDRVWENEEVAALQTVAAAISSTLAREHNLAETNILYQASAELNQATTFEDVLAVLRSHTVLGAGQGKLIALGLFDRPWTSAGAPDWIEIAARWSDTPLRTPPVDRYPLKSFGWLLQNFKPDAPTLIRDAINAPDLDAYSRRWARQQGFVSMILMPLNFSGELRGFVGSFYTAEQAISDTQRRRLMTLASQASVAIQTILLIAESRRRADQLQTAAEIARDTSGTLALDILLDKAAELIRSRFGYYHTSIFLIDPGDGETAGSQAIVRASTGAAGEEMKRRGHSLMVGSRSVVGQTTATGQPVVINDVSQDSTHRPNPLLPETRSELGLPLRLGDRVIGALDLQSTQVNAFKPDDILVLQVLCDQIAIAVENATAYALSQRAVEEMKKADQLKSQFLANMSHELRTPLNSIIGFSRVILKGIDGPVTELQQQDLTAIYNSGQHLLNLINDILDLSKIEAGKMELSFEDNVSLPDLIQSVTSTVTGLIKDKPIQLLKEIAPELPGVRADPTKLRQVLINLLSNAAKFTEQGSITLRAEPQIGKDGVQEVLISVIDTGPGISAEDQKKLFLPFSQVDGSPTRKSGGSGLGLSICRRLVEMHGGQIGVVSEVGQGSTFYFTVPVSLKERLNLPKPQPGKRVVLSIDEDAQVTAMYERYLRDQGCQVIAISDPRLAIEAARQLHPVAITLDTGMSAYDGWEVLATLHSDPITRHVPVIVCTLLDNRERAFKLGASAYLLKPILEEDLVQAFHQATAPAIENPRGSESETENAQAS